MNIHYKLSFPFPHTHYTYVEMILSEINQEILTVKMAVWTPGSYLIREYSQFIDLFDAFDDKGIKLQHRKVEKNIWKVDCKGKTNLSIKYRFYGFDATVRTNFVDSDKASLNGAPSFLYIEGQETTQSVIEIIPYKTWTNIATALVIKNKDKWIRVSENLDQLIDSPIEIGNFAEYHFEAAGIPHHVAIVGPSNANNELFVIDLERVCNVAADFFLDSHPCKEYLFIVQNTEDRYNGLEHLHSTVCQVPRWDYFPNVNYTRLIGLMAHEYFHLWNVKRIRPKSLGPFNYDKENFTNLLWMAEGVTSYYDDYIVYKSGIISEDQYLKIIAKNLTKVVNKPGDDIQSLAEASLDAWIKFYRKNENSDNNLVSYYEKGATITMALNFLIMFETNGEKSFDDVMRELYQKFKNDPTNGFTEEEFLNIAEGVAGVGLSDFFQKYIHGTKQLYYKEYFEYLGLELVNVNESLNNPYLGMAVKWEEGKLMIKALVKHYGAYLGGLNVNDEIIAIDNFRVDTDYEKIFAHKKIGMTIKVLIERDGLIRGIYIPITKDNRVEYQINKMEMPSQLALKLRNKWLNSN